MSRERERGFSIVFGPPVSAPPLDKEADRGATILQEDRNMKIETLIKALQETRRKCGDKEVLFASDPEGNGYNQMGEVLSIDEHDGKILIFPDSQISPNAIGL